MTPPTPPKKTNPALKALTTEQVQRATPVPGGEFDDDDKTPVSGDPLRSLEHHTRQAQKSARATLGEVQMLHTKIDQYIETDQREHRRLSEGMAALNVDMAAIQVRSELQSEQFDKFGDKVDAIGAGQATVTGQMSVLLDELQGRRRLDEHRAKVTIETAAIVERTTIEDQADAKKTSRQRNLKLLGLISSALGAGGIGVVIIVALLDRC